jgi:large subunit ribosomal protein L10
MARPDKAAAVAELAEEFRSSAGAVLTEFRGLTVSQLQELRRALGEHATYTVVKNTLTKIAAKDAGVESFEDLLVGPSAIAFIRGDVVAATKGLRDFARMNPPLVIKGGVLDGKPLTLDEIARLADLESREALLANLAGALLASLQNAAYLFSAPLTKTAQLAAALAAKAEQDPSILTGSPAEATASAPEASAEETPEAAEGSAEETREVPVADANDSSERSDETTNGT